MALHTLSALLTLCGVRLIKTFVRPAHVMARRAMAVVARLTLVWLVLHVFNAEASTSCADVITWTRAIVAAAVAATMARVHAMTSAQMSSHGPGPSWLPPWLP